MTTTDAEKRLAENQAAAGDVIAARLFLADPDADHTTSFGGAPVDVQDRYRRLAQAAVDALAAAQSPTERRCVMLAGFKASNHPQQTAKHGASDEVDDRGTDPAFIATLEERFGAFTLDVAAAEHNAKASEFYTRAADGLARPWRGRVWCNPPYSDCGAWVRKAWQEWTRTDLSLIAMLLPANRVEQGWWQDSVEPYRDRHDSPLRVEFLRGRMRFDRPDWTPGPKGDRPPFGCALLIWQNPSIRPEGGGQR